MKRQYDTAHCLPGSMCAMSSLQIPTSAYPEFGKKLLPHRWFGEFLGCGRVSSNRSSSN